MATNKKTFKPASLPVARWPAADQVAWAEACRPVRRFERGGRASHLKPTSRNDLVQRYGAFLGFLDRTGRLDVGSAAAALVTPENVAAYLDELRGRVCSVTCHGCIYKLRRMAEILNPAPDLSWLREIEAELDYLKRPAPKHHRLVMTGRLIEAGLSLFEQAEVSDAPSLTRARMARDGLMIALLAYCPIRLRAFTHLEIGQNFVKIGDDWWIILSGAETKSERPDEKPVHTSLTPYIGEYLATWHLKFPMAQAHLWPSLRRSAMSYDMIYSTIRRTTRELIGTAINPHLFRDCLVLTNAHLAADRMGLSTALLQHTDPRTTEKHYNRGRMVDAATALREIVAGQVPPDA